jgi:transcriptional repressor NrdR
MVERIVDELTDTFEREVPCSAVGERVMDALRDLDEVAYVRFASVYRRFQEATDFLQALKTLEDEP